MNVYNAGMRGMKGSPDEGGVRVPFFVRWTGKLKPGRDVAALSAHIDLLPTLAELAGLRELPKNQVEGRSLVPLLIDPKAKWKQRHLFTQIARWKTGSEPDEHMWKKYAVRNQRYRLVVDQLYDMKKDPNQTVNIADKHPDVVQSMRAAYQEFWKEARPLMVNETVPMSPTRPFHEWFNKQKATEGIPMWKEPSL